MTALRTEVKLLRDRSGYCIWGTLVLFIGSCDCDDSANIIYSLSVAFLNALLQGISVTHGGYKL